MKYNFNLLGVSPILDFFSHQQVQSDRQLPGGAAYVASQQCRLDAFIQSVEEVSPPRGWDVDEAVEAVIQYWLDNAEGVAHWQDRLRHAGAENLLVARVADLKAMKLELDALIGA
jgi:hypothetical protein